MRNTRTAVAGRAAIALIVAGFLAAGCGSSGSPSAPSTTSTPAGTSAASGQTVLKTGHTTLGTVLTDSKGFTVYWFAKDHGMTSACSGACAAAWPPVTGTPVAGSGVTLAGKLGTISRGGGVLQATYNGHPLYTFSGDTSPGQANGNAVNAFGGLWYAVTTSGGTSTTPSSSSTGGGHGY